MKLLRSGRDQAIRIPREFEVPGYEAILRKKGKRLIVERVRRRLLLAAIALFKPLKYSLPPR